ncbi:pyridoxamine 5'-phosphate oxidase [Streptomyces sp. Ru71]|uniref:pyridoxamine 5'-phosphate oxidase family protein n=1 Tax=Streptomyces sp. Ru71 TaxID=2080746 RepID=UPI000CDD15E3|nr:pyridoxamine 5'-phosphate oxidase family protein [Streptomyces sp. Ru71]POX52576.1 pyridoxamine 5'-phosphate oxidase [Streptomyces sp. Ru71]
MLRDDGFGELCRGECLRLMAAVGVGRLVYTRQALPAVLPVAFRLDADGSVLVCARADSGLVRAVDGAVVAFETDDVDPARRSGWSVVVTGAAAVVTDPAEHARLLRTGPRSWAPSPQEVFVRVTPELVTGRELHTGQGPWAAGLSP